MKYYFNKFMLEGRRTDKQDRPVSVIKIQIYGLTTWGKAQK